VISLAAEDTGEYVAEEAGAEAAGEYVVVGEVVAGAAEKAGASCGLSFTASTEVLLATGKAVPISTLTPGQKVLATNTARQDTGRGHLRRAGQSRHRPYDLQVRAGNRTAVIHTTSNHPFWDQTARRWVKAGPLPYSWTSCSPKHHTGICTAFPTRGFSVELSHEPEDCGPTITLYSNE